ncbi:MAG: UDP-N-acetylmuramoyl-tripeptide--D-alanyl-D-alanine ligase [Thermodesulfobacteriota bacterium]|nr:UDP-N-acetylmuramoyl-tripeptide--D-alanyl-D-alanine ligase [Thermodesulfobacteriota bacterium]
MAAAWGKITAKEIIDPIRGTFEGSMLEAEGSWPTGAPEKPQTVFSGLSTDSRRIRPGELFWALKGERFDGHDFVLKAVERGAAGVVVQKHHLPTGESRIPIAISVDDTIKALGDLAGWWRRQYRVRVFAITGSSGKTTTKEMAASILEMGNRTLKNQGNFNNLIGLPLTILRLEEGHSNMVVEMGMNQPGEIARLTEIADPDVGVITNVGMAHLEGLRDIEGIARAKSELVEKISSKGKVLANGDDELLMKTVLSFRKDVLTFGLGRENDVRACRIRDSGRKGVSFDLRYQGRSMPVRLRTPGLQNVSNALAAAAIGLCSNEPDGHIVEGLARFAGIEGRFTVVPLAGGVTLVDDTYNSNPSSLKAALESVKTLVDKDGRIIVGLGEMMELGDAASSAHLEAGRLVAEIGAHYLLAMGEHAHEMVDGAVKSDMPRFRGEVVKTHSEMVKRIIDEIREKDLILLKGSRKMELGKVVYGLKKSVQ